MRGMAILLLGLTCAPAALTAQTPPATTAGSRIPAALDPTDKRAVVAALATALREQYVFPQVGEHAATKIEAALAAGDYAALNDVDALAQRLTADLAVVAHDKHMRVISITAPPRRPAGGRPRGEGGLFRADRLAGGVGYIEVLGFPPLPVFKAALDRAMTALAGSRALIVDVRRNGGGDPQSVAYLVSYLVAPNRLINSIVSRTPKTQDYTREDFTSVTTPVSFATTPVYVLTGKDTFSGGEEFAYDVQVLKRGTLIGEVTGGGANPVSMVDLGHGLGALIPFGRAENPVTKTNWEGRGVQPAIVVPAADALRTALVKAGVTAAATIEQASVAQVFTPRSTARPGSEAALRQIVAGYVSGAPDYAAMSSLAAEQVREALPERHAQFVALGALEGVTYTGADQMGGDEFRLHFARGDVMMALVLGPAGKIAAISSPMPLSAR